MSDHITVLPPRSGFWQINLGHVLTIISILCTLTMMYSRLSITLEQHTASIEALEEKENKNETAITAIAISDAAQAKDLADMHSNMEEDLVRRLNKDEDLLEQLRSSK